MRQYRSTIPAMIMLISAADLTWRIHRSFFLRHSRSNLHQVHTGEVTNTVIRCSVYMYMRSRVRMNLSSILLLLKRQWKEIIKSLAISSTCSCSIQRLPECLIGFHVAGNFSMRCLISGEIFTRIMVIRKYLLLSSITRSFGRQAVTGHIIRIICS